MNNLSMGLQCVMKSGFYMTAGDNQLSGWTEKLQSTSQRQTYTKRGHGHCLVVCFPSDPLQLPESQQNRYIREACPASWRNAPKTAMPVDAHRSTERAQFSMTTPDHTSHKQCFKSWTKWAMMFCLICHIYLNSYQPTTTFQANQQLFSGKMLPQPAGGGKYFPSVHRIPKHGFLHYRNKQTCLIGKNVLTVMVSILIDKDVWA